MRQRKKTEMYPLVKKWQQSGQSQKAFSKANGLRAHTFQYWVKKYEKEHSSKSLPKDTSEFVPLLISNQAGDGGTNNQIKLSYPNGVCLELPRQVSLNYLRGLIQLGNNV